MTTVVEHFQIKDRGTVVCCEGLAEGVKVGDRVVWAGERHEIIGVEMMGRQPISLLVRWKGEPPPVGSEVTIAPPRLTFGALREAVEIIKAREAGAAARYQVAEELFEETRARLEAALGQKEKPR